MERGVAETLTFTNPSRYRLKAQPPNAFAAFAALTQNISYCHKTNYTIAFAARQNDTTTQSCRLTFFTPYEGSVLTFDNLLTPTWTEYGPYIWHDYQTFRDHRCEQDPVNGSFPDQLQILVQCQGVEGQTPGDVEIELDSIYILPFL